MSPHRCKICGADKPATIVVRRGVPAMLNRLYAAADTARSQKTGDIEMMRCRCCGFSWNATFDPSIIDYSDDYENCQAHSSAFQEHLRSRADLILRDMGNAAVVVEVGCGQGDFLAMLTKAARAGQIARAVGFDPANRGASARNLEIYPEYFSEISVRSRNVSPDVVITRHTIEHVSEPLEFLCAIRAAIGDRAARMFVETPDNTWILRNRVRYDFFYEHCSIFSVGSLGVALERAGFEIVDIQTCFGGQYLWAEARTAPALSVESFREDEDAYLVRWRDTLRELACDGPVLLWGAGAKGVTFCNLIDPDAGLVHGLVDSNPAKQDRYLSGTGHRIVSPTGLKDIGPAHLIIMNPVYEAEIRSAVVALGLRPRFHLAD